MITKELSNIEIMNNPHDVDARNLYNTAEAMITVITLKPGQSLKRHITPVNVAFDALVQYADANPLKLTDGNELTVVVSEIK